MQKSIFTSRVNPVYLETDKSSSLVASIIYPLLDINWNDCNSPVVPIAPKMGLDVCEGIERYRLGYISRDEV